MPRKKITTPKETSFYHEPAVWMVGLAYISGMLMMLLVGVMVSPGAVRESSLEGLSASAGTQPANGSPFLSRYGNSPWGDAKILENDENLLKNGGFELPITRTVSKLVTASNPQFGWDVEWTTRGGRGNFTNQVAGVEILSGYKDWKAQGGAQYARLDVANVTARTEKSRSLVTLSQDVKTQNRSYTLGFWFAPQPGTSEEENKITVRWNGQVVGEISVSGEQDDEPVWKEYSFPLTGSGGLDKLEFIGEGGENGEGNLLDEVSILPTS